MEKLIALADAWKENERRFYRTCRVAEEVEIAAAVAGYRMYYNGVLVAGRWRCFGVGEIQSHCQPHDPDGPGADYLRAYLREHWRDRALVRRHRIAAGLGPIDARFESIKAEDRRLISEICAMPAAAYAGLAVKLGLARQFEHDGRENAAMLRSAHADANRLAQGGDARLSPSPTGTAALRPHHRHGCAPPGAKTLAP